MLNKFLEEYVLKLYNNSNVNMSMEQRNLYSKEKYYVLLKPVVELLKKYPDDTIQELRNKLFLLSRIEGKLKDFIWKKWLQGLSLVMELSLELAIQFKMLEDFYKLCKEKKKNVLFNSFYDTIYVVWR